MNKKMREILSKINSKKELAKSYMDGETKDVEKASTLLAEIDDLQKEYEVEEKLYAMEKEDNEPSEEDTKAKKEVSAKEAFGATVKSFVKKAIDLEEGSNPVHVTVSEDISAEIEKLIEVGEELGNEIEWKPKNTLSGKDRVKARGQYTGFGSVEEGGKIPKAGAPKYNTIDWKVTKYGGYMPVTSELLEDSDADIANDMIDWLANECRVTRNNLVKAVIDEKDAIDLKNLDGIKKAVNVDLGSAFKAISKIVTNDDGLNYLDTLKDQNGRYLLNPDPTNSAKLQLRCGTTIIPVTVYSNDTLASNDTKAPFIIGSLKEGIRGYRRKELSLLSSNVAVVGEGEDQLNAYEQDLTLVRGITRLDAQMRDEKAFINGYIDLSAVATTNEEITG